MPAEEEWDFDSSSFRSFDQPQKEEEPSDSPLVAWVVGSVVVDVAVVAGAAWEASMQWTWAAFGAFPFLALELPLQVHQPSAVLRIDASVVAVDAAAAVAVGLGTFEPFGWRAGKRQSGGE